MNEFDVGFFFIFNDISMTNIAIYIIKMNYGTIVVLIT